jgi:hypothetical protein
MCQAITRPALHCHEGFHGTLPLPLDTKRILTISPRECQMSQAEVPAGARLRLQQRQQNRSRREKLRAIHQHRHHGSSMASEGRCGCDPTNQPLIQPSVFPSVPSACCPSHNRHSVGRFASRKSWMRVTDWDGRRPPRQPCRCSKPEVLSAAATSELHDRLACATR